MICKLLKNIFCASKEEYKKSEIMDAEEWIKEKTEHLFLYFENHKEIENLNGLWDFYCTITYCDPKIPEYIKDIDIRKYWDKRIPSVESKIAKRRDLLRYC